MALKPIGLNSLIYKPEPLTLPDSFGKAEYIILFRQCGKIKLISRQSARKTLIAYGKLIGAGVKEIEVWRNDKEKMRLASRGRETKGDPRYRFVKRSKE